jgi:hypothetical protein
MAGGGTPALGEAARSVSTVDIPSSRAAGLTHSLLERAARAQHLVGGVKCAHTGSVSPAAGRCGLGFAIFFFFFSPAEIRKKSCGRHHGKNGGQGSPEKMKTNTLFLLAVDRFMPYFEDGRCAYF